MSTTLFWFAYLGLPMGPAPAQHESLTREYDWTTDSPCFAIIDAIARFEDVETPAWHRTSPHSSMHSIQTP